MATYFICRTSLGKIGISLFVMLAVGAIILIAMLSPFRKKAMVDEDALLAYIAVREDAPKVTTSVKVLNPDGTPADRAIIRYRTLMIKENPPSFPGDKPSYYPATGGVSWGSDREGNFEFELPPKTIGMIYVHRTANSKTLVSQPTVFEVQKDADNFTIQLQEGTLVSGLAMFDDGTPAVDRTISGVRPIKTIEKLFLPTAQLPAWAKDANVLNALKSNFVLEFQTRVQPDGTFELYLPPGDFLITEIHDDKFAHAVSLSVKDVEKEKNAPKEYRIALTFPAPLRGKFVKEDGSDPGRLNMLYMTKSENHTSSFSTYIMSGGEFSLNKRTGSWLVAVTRDDAFGAIHPVADDQLSVFQTIVLQPTATIKLELRDRLGQPVVGKRVFVSIVSRIEGSSSSAGLSDTPSITDEEGVATFKVPPGRGLYEFSWEGGKLEGERTLSSGETVVIPATMRGHSKVLLPRF